MEPQKHYKQFLGFSFGMLSSIQSSLENISKDVDNLLETTKVILYNEETQLLDEKTYDKAVIYTKELETFINNIGKICTSLFSKREYPTVQGKETYKNYINMFGRKLLRTQPIKKVRSKKPRRTKHGDIDSIAEGIETSDNISSQIKMNFGKTRGRKSGRSKSGRRKSRRSKSRRSKSGRRKSRRSKSRRSKSRRSKSRRSKSGRKSRRKSRRKSGRKSRRRKSIKLPSRKKFMIKSKSPSVGRSVGRL